MPSQTVTKAAGLHTANNELSAVPDGALVKATNVTIRADGVIEPRRGFTTTTYGITDVAAVRELFKFSTSTLCHYVDTFAASRIAYDTGSAWAPYSGTYTWDATKATHIAGVEAQKNFYFTSTVGPYRLSTVSDTPALAGAPYAPGIDQGQSSISAAVTAMSRTANVVTVNTTGSHGFYVGQTVTLNAAPVEADYPSGDFVVTSVPSTTSFTYAQVLADDAASASAHTFSLPVLTGASGFLADGYQVAYRIIICDPDVNTSVKLGAASGRAVVTNATNTTGWAVATSRNVINRVFIPSTCTTTSLVRVYRSESVLAAIEPSDNLGLVYETAVRAIDITRGYIDLLDIVPDALIGPLAYTSPGEGGSALDNNWRPPLCADINFWNDRMFFANTTDLQRLTFNIISVSSGTGIQSGDHIYFGSESWVAGTTGAIGGFKVFSGGTDGANIRDTALSLASAINRDSTLLYAQYSSGENDNPGQITLFARASGQAAFGCYTTGIRTAFAPVFAGGVYDLSTLARTGSTVTMTVGGGVTPKFVIGDQVTISPGSADFGVGPFTLLTHPSSSSYTYTESGAAVSSFVQDAYSYIVPTSTAEAIPHRLFYSKLQQPEAVPLINFVDIGARSQPIFRIHPLRDKLYVFKGDGVFVVSGDAPFRVDCLDPTVLLNLAHSRSVASVANQLYAVTNQGVVAISDAGVAVVSRPVENLLAPGNWGSFAVGYEKEHSYIVRSTGLDGVVGLSVYNTLTNTWTFTYLAPTVAGDVRNAGCGIVTQSASGPDRLVLGVNGVSGGHVIYTERNDVNTTDYGDPGIVLSETVSSYDSASLTLTMSASLATKVAAGDVLYYSTVASGLVASVSASPATVTFSAVSGTWASAVTFTPTHVRAYPCTVQWAANTGSNPGDQKHFRECNFHFRRRGFYAPYAYFASDLSTTATNVEIIAPGRSIATSTGTALGTYIIPKNRRITVPQDKQRCEALSVGFTVTEAWAAWSLNGYTLTYENQSESGTK